MRDFENGGENRGQGNPAAASPGGLLLRCWTARRKAEEKEREDPAGKRCNLQSGVT